eukprot:7109811-Alexandrium_andersonii.AAC.1
MFKVPRAPQVQSGTFALAPLSSCESPRGEYKRGPLRMIRIRLDNKSWRGTPTDPAWAALT